jgi:hypothetical protein
LLASETPEPLRQWPIAEIRPSADHQPGRLASRVGVDYSDSSDMAVYHASCIITGLGKDEPSSGGSGRRSG